MKKKFTRANLAVYSINSFTNILKRVSLITIFSILLFACSKDGGDDFIEDEKSTNSSLSNLKFLMSNNSSLSSNIIGYNNGNVVYATIPEDVSIAELAPTFNVDENAIVEIEDKEIDNGVNAFDFTECVTVKITAQAGNSSEYYICVKNGKQSVDNLVYEFMETYTIPGISITYGGEQGEVYSYGYGFANTYTHEKVTPNHLFRLASVSKQQTSLSIMTLYEQGKLKIDDRVFGNGGLLEEEFGADITGLPATVTVRHLLEHTSGWISDPDPMFTTDAAYSGKSLNERIEYVLENVGQTYTPGSTYSYYNLGYGILGVIIEKLSGKDYETFIQEEIHAKAGVCDINVGGGESERRDNEVVYYSQSGTNGYGNDMEMIKAAGGVIASTHELVKLLGTIDYSNTVPDILKSETLDIMYEPSEAYSRYGLGWRMNHSLFTNWASYHTGNLAGTATIWKRGTDGVHCAILCNSRSYIDGFDTALYILLDDIESEL